MINEIEVGKKYHLIDIEGFVTCKTHGNYNQRLLNDKNVFDENMCVIITTEHEGCGGTDEKEYIILPNEYHFFELVGEDNEQEHVHTELKNKKLIDLLIDTGIQWPEGAEGVIQDSDGEVKFYSGEKPTIDADGIWNRHIAHISIWLNEVVSDCRTAIITKTDWENRKVDKKPMFADIKVGDKVWDICRGWGVITTLMVCPTYPIEVEFKNGHGSYTRDGYSSLEDVNPSLFWDEIKLVAPQKPVPLLEVDTKVVVWLPINGIKIYRHFSHFDEYGFLYVFVDGRTSFTSDGTTHRYDNWELAQ